MVIHIAPDCPAEIDAMIRREAAERGDQVMPARPCPWIRVSSKRQALPKNSQTGPRAGTQLDLPDTAPDPAGLARNLASEPLRPRKPQSPCDHGLFSDDALQADLLDMNMFQD